MNGYAMITCLTYPNNIKYAFKHEHVKIDLYRIVDYCLNKLILNPKKIYIITDMTEITSIQDCHIIYVNSGAHWNKILKQICHKIKSEDKVLFYYTGHGKNNYLMIPKGSDIDYYNTIHQIFDLLPNNSVVIFDCCNGEGIINNYRSMKNIIFISSTKWNQTCGFYKSGSIFTYFLIEYLFNIQSLSIDLLIYIEEKILYYRNLRRKPPQNIFIHLSNQYFNELPKWLLLDFSLP